MSRRAKLLLLFCAVVGYGSLIVLFPRFDNSARWNNALDGRAAIELARAVASEWGVDTSGWYGRTRTVRKGDAHLRYRHDVAEARRLDPLNTLVMVTNPVAAESVRVRLDTKGNVLALQLRHPSVAEATPPDEARQLATDALRRLGADASAYELSSETRVGNTGWRFRWTRSVADAPELTLVAIAETHGGQVERVELDWIVSEEFRKDFLPRIRLLSIMQLIVELAGFILAAGLCFAALVRRRLPVRILLRFSLIAFLFLVISAWRMPGFSEKDFQETADVARSLIVGGYDLRAPVTYLLVIVVPLFFTLLWTAYFGGGVVSLRSAFPRHAAALEELLRGRLSRVHGVAVLGGAAAAGILAALPYLLRSTGLFGDVFLTAHPMRGPLIDFTPLMGNYQDVMFAFLFLVPLVLARRRLPRAVAIPLALLLIWVVMIETQGPALGFMLFVTAVAAGIAWLLFRGFGPLGVLSAFGFAALAVSAAMLLTQESAWLQRSGWLLLLGGAAVAGAASIVAARGVERELLTEYDEGETRSERERMKAELDFARDAQKKMLPNDSPAVPGLEIEGYCAPARQVGGDLYDYLSLPNGHLGVVVADVAGKGVPAALYMTVVKGLLLAAADELSDPSEIAADVNAGLQVVRQKNVFVTMFIAVAAPLSRTVRYVRAGHNPAYLRRAATGEVVALSPGGMALGMTGQTLFRRALRVEEITMESGDALVLYSDGITEAMNERREEYGDERFSELLGSTFGSARELRDAILSDVKSFVGNAPAHDDLTLVVIRAD